MKFRNMVRKYFAAPALVALAAPAYALDLSTVDLSSVLTDYGAGLLIIIPILAGIWGLTKVKSIFGR